MQRVAILYISKLKDVDLYGLLNDIGMANFNKCAIYCLMSILDANYINKARELARKKVENGSESYKKYIADARSPERAGVKLRVPLTSKKYTLAKTVLCEVKSGYCSQFIKTVMRQVLGPQVLMQYFLINDSNIKIEEVPFFTSLINFGALQMPISVQITEKKTRKRRERKRTVLEKEEKKERTSITLPTESTDAPSFGVPVLNDSGVDEKEGIINNEDASTSDDDLLSMLEAMMS